MVNAPEKERFGFRSQQKLLNENVCTSVGSIASSLWSMRRISWRAPATIHALRGRRAAFRDRELGSISAGLLLDHGDFEEERAVRSP